MPVQEEVDEINEFLQKRREKQRLGELPKEDYTPAIAKKISLAIFGKPRTEEKPLLKSNQPTYASTQAQAAMRQQLDEIMESRAPNTIRSAYAPPTAARTTNSAAPKPATTPTSTPAPAPAPQRVPRYYADMPYPPYIQRGLANYPGKKTLVGTPSTPTPAPAPKPVGNNIPASLPARGTPTPAPATPPTTFPARAMPPTAPARTSTPTIPAAGMNKPVAPSSTVNVTPVETKTIPTMTKTAFSTPARSTPTVAPPAPTVASPTQKVSQPFWKKLFAKNSSTQNTVTPPPSARASSPIAPVKTIPAPSPASAPGYAPIPSAFSSATKASATNTTISPVSPAASSTQAASLSRETVSTKTISPPSSNVTQQPPANLLPATTPLPPAIIPESPPRVVPTSRETDTRAPGTPTEFVRRETTKEADVQREKRAVLLQSLVPEKKIESGERTLPRSTAAESARSSSAKYVPPWVSRAGSRDANPMTHTQTSSAAPNVSATQAAVTTLPWRQPFGTGEGMNAESASASKTPAALSPEAVQNMQRARERAAEEKQKIVSGEIVFDELEKENTRDTEQRVPKDAAGSAAMEQEISEEEALEKLPFEEVEGLSESDLDYLSKKEKEHRAVQEKEDGDVGDPHALRDTLQRQSTQLEGALQPQKSPTNDEKQEILRRLKQMMDEEHQS